MSASKKPRSETVPEPPPMSALGRVYWNLRQTLWWIVTRDLDSVYRLPKGAALTISLLSIAPTC
jgi:hypothetical protein